MRQPRVISCSDIALFLSPSAATATADVFCCCCCVILRLGNIAYELCESFEFPTARVREALLLMHFYFRDSGDFSEHMYYKLRWELGKSFDTGIFCELPLFSKFF